MPSHRACHDFHAAEAEVRRSGPRLTRRQLIGAGLAVYAAQALPVTRVFEAAAAEAAASPNAPVLVSVFLPGGLDLLDSLVPLHDYGRYADLRPQLRVEGVPLSGAAGLGIHPSLATGHGGGVKGLYERGKIGLLPGIDYANPDLSHFHSRNFWETGMITHESVPGWLGRWVDRNGGRENPLQGLSMGYSLSPVMRSGRAPVAAIGSPSSAGFWLRDTWGEPVEEAIAAYGRMSRGGPGSRGLRASREAARFSKQVADRLAPYVERDGRDPLASTVKYPDGNEFGERLRYLAAMIEKPLGIRVAAVQADGEFDTHDNQHELATLLADVSHALSAFQADLEARGVADRTLTLVWSEFGRRPEENGSGTDHGAGGIAWVMGNRARPGIHSEYPSLAALDDHDNLRVTVDFRQVYASLIEQHLGTDAAAVIPNAGAFGRVRLVR
jgi:uncharacterized protein (DUF1501 family)